MHSAKIAKAYSRKLDSGIAYAITQTELNSIRKCIKSPQVIKTWGDLLCMNIYLDNYLRGSKNSQSVRPINKIEEDAFTLIFKRKGDKSMESKIYTVTNIKDLLNISRTKAYEYVKKVYKEGKPFKVIKVGENYRIPKTSFDKWLNGE